MVRRMVTQYGMTERLGAVKFGTDGPSRSWAGTWGTGTRPAEEVAGRVDEEVRELIETAHQEAFDILVENRDVLDALVTALLERETLNKEEVAEVFVPVRKRDRRHGPAPRPASRPSGDRSTRLSRRSRHRQAMVPDAARFPSTSLRSLRPRSAPTKTEPVVAGRVSTGSHR